MTKSPKSRPSKSTTPRDDLSDEDAELWRFVTRSITPLQAPRTELKTATSREKPSTAPSVKPAIDAARPRTPTAVPPATRSTTTRSGIPEFDRREARHLSRGRIEIEARIDLHGMRQAAAHRRLLSFLRRAQDDGLKHVLVITGKGRFEEEHHALPFHETLDRTPRGVLRRSVPIWLEEPALSDVVLSYREAAAHHGGSGALYVRLRAAHRTR